MHHTQTDGNLLGWLYTVLGSLLAFGQNYGMGMVGLTSMAFGAWLQWKTYQLREREFELKIHPPEMPRVIR